MSHSIDHNVAPAARTARDPSTSTPGAPAGTGVVVFLPQGVNEFFLQGVSIFLPQSVNDVLLQGVNDVLLQPMSAFFLQAVNDVLLQTTISNSYRA